MISFAKILFFFGYFILISTFYITQVITFQIFITNWTIRILHIVLFLISLTSYFKATITDAGPITISNIPEPRLSEILSKSCQKCNNNWKPPRAHHCRVCKKCVFRMDHHCVWINNCIGSHNQKYFVLFNFYTFLISLFTLICHTYTLIAWSSGQNRLNQTEILIVKFCGISTIIFSIFFAIFTGYFLYDQLSAIIMNSTCIEQKKNAFGRPRTFSDNINQVFGTRNWFLPTKPQINMNYLELIYGVEHIKNNGIYLEDQFWSESSQFYTYFQKFKVQ